VCLSEEVEGNYIRTPKFKIKIPELIVLHSYNTVPKYSVRLSRRNLLIRDKFRCQYTGKKLNGKNATIDHVIPRSRGGKTTWDNVVIASIEANNKKANRTPEEAGMKLLSTPKKPHWNSHLFSLLPKEKPTSWKPFIDPYTWNENEYWDVELEN
jgi:5-methylcytosine-specific restriction endonuclease McrA